MNYEEGLQKAQYAIEKSVRPGEKFELKSLFQGHEWEKLANGERRTFGSYFSKAVKEGRIKYVQKCENTKTHHNQYIKVE